MRHASGIAVLVTATALWAAAPAMAALGLSVNTPTVSLTLKPGQTATGSGTLIVTPGIGTWQLSVADLTGNKGHLAKGITCPSYAEAQTANALTIRVTGPLSTSSGTKTVSDVAQTVATGTLTDTLTDNLALVVASNEAIPTICTFSTTLTYTLQ